MVLNMQTNLDNQDTIDWSQGVHRFHCNFNYVCMYVYTYVHTVHTHVHNIRTFVCMCVYKCQQSMSHTMGEGSGRTFSTPMRHDTAPYRLLVLPQEDFPVMTHST